MVVWQLRGNGYDTNDAIGLYRVRRAAIAVERPCQFGLILSIV